MNHSNCCPCTWDKTILTGSDHGVTPETAAKITEQERNQFKDFVTRLEGQAAIELVAEAIEERADRLENACDHYPAYLLRQQAEQIHDAAWRLGETEGRLTGAEHYLRPIDS